MKRYKFQALVAPYPDQDARDVGQGVVTRRLHL